MWLRSDVAGAVAQASSCSSNLTPGLGTSLCHRCGPGMKEKREGGKRSKKKKKKKKKKSGHEKDAIKLGFFFFFGGGLLSFFVVVVAISWAAPRGI